MRALLEARPHALIAALTSTPHPETLSYLRGPYCVHFLNVHQEIKGPVVTVEDSGGARQAVQHLLNLGHRRIGFVGPPATNTLGEARLRGFNQALRAAGMELPRELIQLGPSTPAFGSAAVESLLALRRPPTVIYLSTAPLSLGGVRLLSERKVRIPGDISLVVAGNSPWYEIWPGGLTSVSLPMTELADTASDLVLRRPADRGRKKFPTRAARVSPHRARLHGSTASGSQSRYLNARARA